MIETNEIKELLAKHNMKATLQRIVIYKQIASMRSHPTADEIHSALERDYPTISLGTVYNTLTAFATNNLIEVVKSEAGTVRYDAIMERHHHLYCEDKDMIKDYYDNELDEILEDYFKRKSIPGFQINDFKLQINGNFLNNIKNEDKNEHA